MASDDELADSLLERLVSDPAFRAEFRRDPVAAPTSSDRPRSTAAGTSLVSPRRASC